MVDEEIKPQEIMPEGITDDTESVDSEADNKNVKQKKKDKKPKQKGRWKCVLPWTLLIVLVVGGGLGMAAYNWHNQPEFCGICHDTMGSYLETYEEGNGLARIHNEANVTCIECHEPTVNQQVSEAMVQVTGDYKLPLRQRSFDDEMCLKCHISVEHLQAKTDLLDKDPHGGNIAGHQNFTCGNCHKVHSDQVDQCSKCHDSGEQRMISYPLERHEK